MYANVFENYADHYDGRLPIVCRDVHVTVPYLKNLKLVDLSIYLIMRCQVKLPNTPPSSLALGGEIRLPVTQV
jgi:hypothetical protein